MAQFIDEIEDLGGRLNVEEGFVKFSESFLASY